jgi:hypothetical protein
MNNVDVILYFCGVHSSHVHKYLNLNNQLNNRCNSVLILDNGKWGISKDHILKFKEEDLKNTIHCDNMTALNILSSFNYKLAVLSSNFRKGGIENRDVSIAKSRGIKTIQISEMNIDFYYSGSDYVSLISEEFERKTSLSKTLSISKDRKFYSNCFLWDKIENCLPYKMSKIEFCKKYNLNPEKNIFMWGPDSIQCQHENAQKAYREACKVENLIVKLHPNELRRHKAERFGNKWSYNMFPDRTVTILDPIDTHWAFEHIDCLLAYQSTLPLEAPFFKKPTVYIGTDDPDNALFDSSVAYYGNYEWVGTSCKYNNIQEVLESGSFDVDESEYDKYLDRWLQDPNRSSVDILCDQIVSLL